MKALTVKIYSQGNQIRMITETENTHIDTGWDWGSDTGQVDSDSEAGKAIRDKLLGVVADLNWEKMVRVAVVRDREPEEEFLPPPGCDGYGSLGSGVTK